MSRKNLHKYALSFCNKVFFFSLHEDTGATTTSILRCESEKGLSASLPTLRLFLLSPLDIGKCARFIL